jgi:hypothetical protein
MTLLQHSTTGRPRDIDIGLMSSALETVVDGDADGGACSNT